MDYPSVSGAPVYPKQRRAPERNLNVPMHRSVAPEYHPRDAAPEVPMPSKYQKSLQASDPKFVRPTIQRPNVRKTSAVRPEQEGYYDNYYTSPSPPPGRSNAYQVYRQQNPVESGYSTYEDEGEEEEEEEEEEEIDTDDYIPDPPQQKRHVLRTQEYYPTVPAREVSYCDPYITQAQRRISKSPVRSYDIQQPTSDGILPPRPRSPLPYTRQQMSEPFHNRHPQNKAGKLTSRSFYDSEGRLYTRSRSPESELYEERRTQDYRLLGKPRREMLLGEIRQQREGEDLKQIFPNSEDSMLGDGNEETTKPSQQCPLSTRDCLNLAAKEDEYLKKLQHLFKEEANDVEKLIAVKKAELERRNARNRSPVGSFYQ